MRLTLAIHPISSIGFGNATRLDGTNLVVGQGELERLILEDGSRASFEKSLRLDGYASIEEFRKDLRSSFLRLTVQGVLGGVIPSPSQGIRTLAQPTPAEIRAAYEAREAYRHVESELQWAQLQFFKDRDKPPAEDRAAEVSNRLGAGLMTVEEALKDADKVRRNGGIPDGMLAEFVEFLESAEPGECKQLPTSAGGVAQLMVIIGRTEARDFSFQEAQLIIVKDLTAANRDIAVAEALSDLYRESYVWVNPAVPGLAALLEADFGGGNPVQEADEL